MQSNFRSIHTVTSGLMFGPRARTKSLIKLPNRTNHDSTVKVGHKKELIHTGQISAKMFDSRLGRDHILIMK